MLLNQDICRACHATSLEYALEEQLPRKARNWYWEPEQKRLWNKGKIECPPTRTPDGGRVLDIDKPPPSYCPFHVDHLMANQC